MNNVFNVEKEEWKHPWNIEAFDNLYNRDERFFSIVIKGLISWLNRNIVLYNKSINHFIFNTGSSYLYIESNGYEYSLTETTGEDTMYQELPRCILEFSNVSIPTEELTAPYARGYYERQTGNMLMGYNAEIRRLPLEIVINAKYYLSNFNETIILLQELLDKLVFQKYFTVTYLGQEIQCSIEFPADMNPEINKIDMSSPEPNQRNLTLDFRLVTNYPIINERSEIPTDKVIGAYAHNTILTSKENDTDVINQGTIIDNDRNGFNDVINEANKKYVQENSLNENDELTLNSTVYLVDQPTAEEEISYITKEYIEDLLEKIKYDNDDESYDENNDNKLNYKDLEEIIKKVNTSENTSIEYDPFISKIIINHNDTGKIEEIDLSKYKIVKNE